MMSHVMQGEEGIRPHTHLRLHQGDASLNSVLDGCMQQEPDAAVCTVSKRGYRTEVNSMV